MIVFIVILLHYCEHGSERGTGGDTASLCFLQPQMVGGAKARSLAYARCCP